jgi:outer membrane usher protein
LLRSLDDGDNSARLFCGTGIFLLLLTLVSGQAAASDAVIAPTTAAASGAVVDPETGAVTGVSADETLLLDVQVNGHSIGKVGEFTLRHGKMLARPDELRDLGFRIPASLIPGRDGLISLSDVPGLSWTVDQKAQELWVTVSDSRLLPTVLMPNGRETAEAHRTIESGTGVTLNYDLVNTLAGGQTGATGALDLRAFSPWGVASSGWLAYAGVSTSGSGTHTPIRLDSAYTFSDVNALRRYVLGDFVTSGLAWTRPIRLEGVQIRSDFSMRPDLVTFPLPSVAGSAAVPSTVEVLADGNLMVSSQIAAGPFETRQLPVMSGAGTISMTVTNALGAC